MSHEATAEEHAEIAHDHGPTPSDRSRMAYAAVQAVLAEHGCRIVTTMHPEQIGAGPLSRVIIDTSWGVMPLDK